MTSNPLKSDENKRKLKKEAKNDTSENQQLSSFEKPDVSHSESFHRTEALETVLNDTSKEINVLLSKYAHVLSERAVTDASYIAELEGILKEACSIEHHLKLKRENLRFRFAALAGPPQSENGLSGK